MGKLKKKFESGTATNYISRNRVLKKLQISLPNFRRLCIIKGIYPHEPKNIKKANKGSTASRTFYLRKDIKFLLNEPLIDKFREFKIFLRKYKNAINKRDFERARRIKNAKPKYKLDNIVKERYPSFIDAVRDLDDCLSMVNLFSTFPATKLTQVGLIKLCRRLSVEFMNYVVSSKSLRKVFVSIKGYYYQAEIMGENITWVIPHFTPFQHPEDVDYKIMHTFVDFYTYLLGFVNYKLYNSFNLQYPPQIITDNIEGAWDGTSTSKNICNRNEVFQEKLATFSFPLQPISNIVNESCENDIEELLKQENVGKADEMMKEEEKKIQVKHLFRNLKFFLNREVPKEPLTFVIRSCDGQVSWDTSTAPGSSYKENDDTITHQVVDRDDIKSMHLNRIYIQPQWIFDSINQGKLLPVKNYLLGAVLPPHLSPFVEYNENKYIPPEARPDEQVVSDENSESSDLIENSDDSDEGIDSENNLKDISADESNQSDDEDNDEEEGDDDDDNEDEVILKKVAPKLNKPNKNKIMQVSKGIPKNLPSKSETEKAEAKEHLKLAEMMASKKHRHIYNKIIYGKKREEREKRILEEKRKKIDESKKTKKTKKTISN